MPRKTKPLLSPDIVVIHDQEGYYIEVELPGVKKKDLELEVAEQGFTVKGSRSDFDFVGSYYLAHQVNTEKVKAKFDDGLLDITIPLKQPLKVAGKKISIE